MRRKLAVLGPDERVEWIPGAAANAFATALAPIWAHGSTEKGVQRAQAHPNCDHESELSCVLEA